MAMKIHYTEGYGGKLNYITLCGKEIHSHDKKETAVIHPEKVTCKGCIKTSDWKQDLADLIATSPNIKRRIYLESDILHATELRSAQREVAGLCEERKAKYVRRVFSEVLDSAWHDLAKTWEAVKKADEIYSDSSLLPLCGGSYMGAPVIFNGMCERAIKENVTGKDVYILNSLKNINWYMINFGLMVKAFKKNNLFMYDNGHDKLILVDVKKVIKENKD